MYTKANIIDRVVGSTGLSKRAAARTVDLISNLVKEDLHARGVAIVPGIGRLKLTDRAGRSGRNPRTGESLTIPACKAVRFRPSAGLRRSVQVTQSA